MLASVSSGGHRQPRAAVTVIQGGVRRGRRHLDGDLLAGGPRRGRLDRARAHGDDRHVGVDFGLDGERAAEDRVDGGTALACVDDVIESTPEPIRGGQPARDLLCRRRWPATARPGVADSTSFSSARRHTA